MVDELEVTINCHKLSSKFTKKISVTTNDPDHPTEYLTCRGEILEAVRIVPERVMFGQVPRNGEPSRTVNISQGDAGPLDLKLKPEIPEGVKAELRAIEPGVRYELEVTLTPPYKSERIQASLALETGVPRAPVATIPIYGSVTPRVSPHPPRFTVPGNRKADWQQAVRLVWDDESTHTIVGASTDDPALKVRVDEQDGVQQVVLEVPQAFESKRTSFSVTVTTDDAEMPELRVPVFIQTPRPVTRVKRMAAPPRTVVPTPTDDIVGPPLEPDRPEDAGAEPTPADQSKPANVPGGRATPKGTTTRPAT